MKIKRVNEDFDIFKDYDNSYKRQVKDVITIIIADVHGISEKSFKAYEHAMDISKEIVDNEEDVINEYETHKRRKELCGEIIFEKYLENIKEKINGGDLKNKTK